MNFPSRFLPLIIALCLGAVLPSCRSVAEPEEEELPGMVHFEEKMDGVAFVSPRDQIGQTEIDYILNSKAGWIQIIPYAFSRPGEGGVTYNPNTWWWGESMEGTRFMVRAAHAIGLKVLIKPHVWIWQQGWAGEFTLTDEAQWQIWEAEYQDYIMTFAELGQEEGVEMICVGTELKGIVRDRPDYFGRLADTVRTVFQGPVTYAANWDNYHMVQFWDKMDIIGVDAYFPLVEADTPAVADLVQAWQVEKANLKALSDQYHLPILFTEWGYLSVDKAGWRTWELEANLENIPLNLKGQSNCYEAMFQTFWEEPWFAGGFAWQWYADHPNAGGVDDKDHTPQNKPALAILIEEYAKH